MEREEAIKILMGYSHTPEERAALETLIPELAESEDERIRKELIEAFEVYDIESSWNLIPVKHILAWLEKQKVVSEYGKALYFYDGKNFHFAGNPVMEEKQKEPHYTKINALFDKCVENCDPTVMKKVSDEVDEMLEKEKKVDIDKLRRDLYQSGYNDGYQHGREDEQKEQKPSHKFNVGDTIHCKYDDREFAIKSVDLANGVYKYTKEGCGNDIDYADENFELVEQKPAEWSEED